MRVPDRAVLAIVLQVQLVEVGPGRPHRLHEERPPRCLRHPLDERNVGRPVDHVVERVVEVEPLARDLEILPPVVAHLHERSVAR